MSSAQIVHTYQYVPVYKLLMYVLRTKMVQQRRATSVILHQAHKGPRKQTRTWYGIPAIEDDFKQMVVKMGEGDDRVYSQTACGRLTFINTYCG
jgi:hypothetical protein